MAIFQWPALAELLKQKLQVQTGTDGRWWLKSADLSTLRELSWGELSGKRTHLCAISSHRKVERLDSRKKRVSELSAVSATSEDSAACAEARKVLALLLSWVELTQLLENRAQVRRCIFPARTLCCFILLKKNLEFCICEFVFTMVLHLKPEWDKMPSFKMRTKFGLLFVVLVACQNFWQIHGSSVNDCVGVKYAYSAKGLDQSDVPRQPRQGKPRKTFVWQNLASPEIVLNAIFKSNAGSAKIENW